MNKYLILIGAIVVIGAALTGIYGKKLIEKPNSENKEQNQNQGSNEIKDTVNPNGAYSINELFTMNKPLKCTWKESTTGDKDVTNIMYINGKNFYQDVTMGDVGHAYTISNGEYLYMWNDFTDVASKMKFSEIITSPNPEQTTAKNTASLDQKRDFLCEKWTVDAKYFTPPSDKNFKDVTEEMNQATENLNNGGLEQATQQMCALCEKAPTQEIKDKCLEDAQCN